MAKFEKVPQTFKLYLSSISMASFFIPYIIASKTVASKIMTLGVSVK